MDNKPIYVQATVVCENSNNINQNGLQPFLNKNDHTRFIPLTGAEARRIAQYGSRYQAQHLNVIIDGKTIASTDQTINLPRLSQKAIEKWVNEPFEEVQICFLNDELHLNEDTIYIVDENG